MKKTYIYLTLCIFAFLAGACSEDDLNSSSIFDETYPEKNAFEQWIATNYTEPYNIDFKYRMEDKEINQAYNLVPAEFEKSVILAQLVKFLWLDAYTELLGEDFMKTHTPRIIQLIGSPEYDSEGSIVLGTAEGGLKISLFNVNNININNISVEQLNQFYFKTMHHEFSHILHQKKEFTTDFRLISADKYTSSDWINKEDDWAWNNGFISKYGSSEYHEDFVELISVYVTSTPERWNEILSNASKEGRAILLKKFNIIRDYLMNSWNFDIIKLRDIVQRRYTEVPTLDLKTF